MHVRTGMARAILVAIASVILPVSTSASVPAHYIVFEVAPSGTVEPVFFREVHLAALPESLPDVRLETAMDSPAFATGDAVALRVEDPSGETLYRQTAQVPRRLRGEFRGKPAAGGGWTIDAHQVDGGVRAFAVRIPAVAGGRLVIDGPTRSTFDINALAAGAGAMRLGAMAGIERSAPQFLVSGSPANRADILIMGDGYTAAQQTLFDAHVGEFETWFFAMTPYGEYKNFVNVSSLFVASTESGADHPPYDAGCSGSLSCCSDPDAQTDPLAGTFVDTAFDGRFCAFDIHRLLIVDTAAIFAAAAAAPDWDKIVVAVNDPVYGGSGGPLSVTSVHDDGLEIIQHEFGHSFTGLADEYDAITPGYPPCSDVTGPACEPNVTDETVRSLIKWESWIEPATPIPTPELPAYANVVGLFEGARYRPTGMYRSRDLDCMMNVFAPGFCQVCSQEYILKLYAGGWGVPAGGIDLIEPGSESPPTGMTVDGSAGATLLIGLLEPVGAPPVNLTWLVDGVPEPPQSGVPRGSYDFSRSTPGLYQVQAQVDDVTPLVHADMASGLLRSTATWSVQVGSGTGPGEAVTLSVGPSWATPGRLLVSWQPSCSAEAVNYAVYEGTLGNWYSHTLKDCSDDGVPFEEEIEPGAGSTYYLVVPLSAAEEGSYGLDSSDFPRPRGTAVCKTSQIASTCP